MVKIEPLKKVIIFNFYAKLRQLGELAKYQPVFLLHYCFLTFSSQSRDRGYKADRANRDNRTL